MLQYLRCLIIISAFFVFYSASGQDTIRIKYGPAATIDGVISPGEWDGVDSVQISIAGGKLVTVYFKHDGSSLFLAYLNNLGSMSFRFPEVMLDVNNDKSSGWLNDDFWFHVSTVNCYNQGLPKILSNCSSTKWEANNFSSGLPDTVEIRIPFSMDSLDIDIAKTIGISFDVTNSFSIYEHWPQTANIDTPSTWGNAIFLDQSTGAINSYSDHAQLINFQNSPNPSNGISNLSFYIPENTFVVLKVFDANGKVKDVLVNEKLNKGQYTFEHNSTDLTAGIYLYQLEINGKRLVNKFVITK